MVQLYITYAIVLGALFVSIYLVFKAFRTTDKNGVCGGCSNCPPQNKPPLVLRKPLQLENKL